ncbi:GDP-mannose mannosyl hydrolase [Escherichia coli]|nr:GDP-mannose mannosyl hydrolase [Escherichia coli]
MMFLRQEDFATVVRSTPLVSLDFIVENSRGEFSAWQKNQPPGAGLLVCAGRARAERRNAGSRI